MSTPPSRLVGVHDGTVYAVRGTDIVSGPTRPNRRATTGEADRQPARVDLSESVGRVPTPTTPRLLCRLTTGRAGAVTRLLVGDVSTTAVFRLSASTWLATAGPRLYRSTDAGENWDERLALPSSSGPMGVLPSAVCRADGRVYLGEYPLGDEVPRIHVSTDDGRDWAVACRLPGARHVHAVQTDPFTGDVWVTTGDADAECAIGRLRHAGDAAEFERVGGGSQAWRAVELAFTPTAVLWGMDCGHARANTLYRLDRAALGADGDPTPVAVGATANSIYYAATVETGGDYWVVFATAVETGRDRTAPGRSTHGTGTARVVAASAATDYTDWHELLAFERRSRLADAVPRLPTANAYVYLGTDANDALVVNPFNTATDNGRILVVPADRLRAADGPVELDPA